VEVDLLQAVARNTFTGTQHLDGDDALALVVVQHCRLVAFGGLPVDLGGVAQPDVQHVDSRVAYVTFIAATSAGGRRSQSTAHRPRAH